MKKVILCSVFVFFGLILLTGCGKSNLKEYAGIYKLEYSKYVGDPDTAKNTTETAEMVLNEDGTLPEHTYDFILYKYEEDDVFYGDVYTGYVEPFLFSSKSAIDEEPVFNIEVWDSAGNFINNCNIFCND